MTFDPVCLLCQHLRPDGLSCRAYPRGIPLEILHVRSLHLRPRGDDGGVTFRLRQDTRSIEAARRMVELGQLPRAVLEAR